MLPIYFCRTLKALKASLAGHLNWDEPFSSSLTAPATANSPSRTKHWLIERASKSGTSLQSNDSSFRSSYKQRHSWPPATVCLSTWCKCVIGQSLWVNWGLYVGWRCTLKKTNYKNGFTWEHKPRQSMLLLWPQNKSHYLVKNADAELHWDI